MRDAHVFIHRIVLLLSLRSNHRAPLGRRHCVVRNHVVVYVYLHIIIIILYFIFQGHRHPSVCIPRRRGPRVIHRDCIARGGKACARTRETNG